MHVQPTLGCFESKWCKNTYLVNGLELEDSEDSKEESSEEGSFFWKTTRSTRSLSLIAMKPITSFRNAMRQLHETPSLWSFLLLIEVVNIIFEQGRMARMPGEIAGEDWKLVICVRHADTSGS